MDDEMLDLTEPGDRITGRLLQAYGDDHLSPSMAATTRMRTSVMSAAHRRAALMEADATFGAAGRTTTALAAKRVHAARNAWRRPVVAVLAGCLTLAMLSGTAFAARPGGPLYGARLWTEMANLPAGLVDRAQAEVDRLEQRIDEAQQGLLRGRRGRDRGRARGLLPDRRRGDRRHGSGPGRAGDDRGQRRAARRPPEPDGPERAALPPVPRPSRR